MNPTKSCATCSAKITKKPTHSKTAWKKVRYCSRACANEAFRGRPNRKTAEALRGRKLSASHRAKISAGMKRAQARGHFRVDNTGLRGPETSQWKGDKAKYRAIHARIVNERGRADSYLCVDCGEEARQWSYKGRVGFSPDVNDYEPRCVPCHRAYDRA